MTGMQGNPYMTDVTTLLAGIKTLEEAATEGPWASYGDLGHEVFRNTGIEDEEPTKWN